MRFTNRKYSVKEVIVMLTIVMVGIAAVSYGAVTIPNTFTAGTTAKAADVNANFSYLTDRSWDKSGSSLIYNGGVLGIGTSNPKGAVASGAGSIQLGGATTVTDMTDASVFFSNAYFDGTTWRRVRDGYASGYIAGYGSQHHGTLELDVAPYGTADSEITALTYGIFISNNGNVGFGVVPSYPVHSATGAYLSAGGVWTNASSRAYKDNIAKLNAMDAMKALKELEPVTYSYKADKNEKHVGFIAEDVPALVATKDRKGLSSMDMVAVLTKVVQEQQRTIEAMQMEIKEMKRSQ